MAFKAVSEAITRPVRWVLVSFPPFAVVWSRGCAASPPGLHARWVHESLFS